MTKIDLETLAKEYAAGRISREDFLYLHQMLTQQAQQVPQKRQPVQQRRTPQQAPQKPVKRPQTKRQPTIQQQPQYLGAQLPGSQSPSVFGFVRRHHKEAVALIGTLGIFLSMYYNKIDTRPKDTPTARVVVVQNDNVDKPTRLRSEDVKLIAELIMENNSWTRDLINDFISQWDKLSLNERVNVKRQDWYFKFSTMLSKQINVTRKKADAGDVSAIYSQQALLEIADKLIFDDNPDAKKILAALSGAEQQKKQRLKEMKDKPISSRELVPEPKSSRKPQIAKIRKQTAKNSKPTTKSDKKYNLSDADIKNIFKRFSVSFRSGDTKQLINLFANDEYSTSFTSLDAIKDDYRSMFRNTRERKLELSAFDWEHDYDEARGKGVYHATVRLKHNNVTKTITADVDITLRRIFGKIQITDFRLKNKEIVTSTSRFKKNLKKRLASSKSKPKFPTQSELQDLVTQYITAYETGDVDELVSLFAGATWKQGRSAKLEMKSDYQDLFRTTKDREVYVDGIKWSFKKNKALGTGDLIVTLHSADSGETTTRKGKIRIVAKRMNNDKVQFQQVFHVLD